MTSFLVISSTEKGLVPRVKGNRSRGEISFFGTVSLLIDISTRRGPSYTLEFRSKLVRVSEVR